MQPQMGRETGAKYLPEQGLLGSQQPFGLEWYKSMRIPFNESDLLGLIQATTKLIVKPKAMNKRALKSFVIPLYE